MHIQRFAAVLLVLAFSGCSVVAIDQPVGEKLTVEQLQEFAGVWVNTKGDPEPVEFRAADDGRLITGHLKWDEEQQAFQVESQVLLPRRAGGQTYLFFQAGKTDKAYLFGRVELEPEGKMAIHLPDANSFRTAVENGALPGRVEESEGKKATFTVHLKAQNDATRRFLASADWRKHFTQEPQVLHRLKAAVEPANDEPNPDSPQSPSAPAQ